MIHLDTNVLVWLHGGQQGRLPQAVHRLLEVERLGISPMVELELQYLFEVGKVSEPAQDVLAELAPTLGLSTSTAPFHSVVREAVALRWTRDPFDRLIAAHAIVDDAALLTADQHLLKHLPRAVWDDSESDGA